MVWNNVQVHERDMGPAPGLSFPVVDKLSMKSNCLLNVQVNSMEFISNVLGAVRHDFNSLVVYASLVFD